MKRLVRAVRAGAGALSLASLAACNLAPAYRPPTLAVADRYKPIAGWDTAQPLDLAARGDWWTLFGDPLLNDLETRLTRNNPDLEAAVARYDGARAYARQARAGLLPSIGLDGNATHNRQSDDRPLRGSGQPDVYDSDQANAVIGYELDLWGKLRNELTSRKALAQASDADRAAIQLSLQAQLATTYFQLRGLDADAELLTGTVDAYRKSHDLTEILYKGKIAAQMDVSRAAVQLNAAETTLADIVGRRALLANAIAILVGESPSTFSVGAGDLPASIPAIPAGIPATLLQRRPDVASAERAIASANAQIGVARAAFFPSISFNALGGIQSAGSDPFKVGDLFWSLGPSVSLPIFQGGRLKGQLAAAYARFREASAHYRSTALTAFRQVEDDRALLGQLDKEARFTGMAVGAARQTSDASTSLYRAGATSYLDVVTAQTALLQAQQSALDVRTRQFAAAVDLVRALGGGWREDALSSR